jgi:hypothetical protein
MILSRYRISMWSELRTPLSPADTCSPLGREIDGGNST